MFSPSAHLLLADSCSTMELLFARCHIDCGTCCRFFCSSSCRWSNDVGVQIILCMFFCYSPKFEGLQIFFSLESVWISQEVVLNVFNLPAAIFPPASRNYFAKLLPQMLLQRRKLLRVSPPVVDHWILVQSEISWYSCWFDLAWTSSDFLSRPWPCMVSLTWSRKLIK